MKKIKIPIFKSGYIYSQFPLWLSGNDPPARAEDMGSIPVSGRSPGEGNGNRLQYSCLGNSMDRGAQWAIVHVIAKELDKIQQLNNQYIFS